MNASAVHPLHSSRATGPRDSLLRRACQESKPIGCKVLIRCDLVERGGSSEAWSSTESKPSGGKIPLRRDVIERGGSSEAWYGGRARRSVGQRTAGDWRP